MLGARGLLRGTGRVKRCTLGGLRSLGTRRPTVNDVEKLNLVVNVRVVSPRAKGPSKGTMVSVLGSSLSGNILFCLYKGSKRIVQVVPPLVMAGRRVSRKLGMLRRTLARRRTIISGSWKNVEVGTRAEIGPRTIAKRC